MAQNANEKTGTSSLSTVEAFPYPVCPGAPPLPAWNGWVEVSANDTGRTPAHERGNGRSGLSEAEPPEETRQSFEAGRERGLQEGHQAEREVQSAALEVEKERRERQLANLTESFARERDRYLQSVEQEVVRLALAVAARILRREAQMDPLLLAGAVRVALGQLAGSCEVRLKVPAAELALWTEAIALVPNMSTRPVIVAGEGMRLGDCAIESKVGTVDLGVRSQLGEIERGFFDRFGASAHKRAAPENAALSEVER